MFAFPSLLPSLLLAAQLAAAPAAPPAEVRAALVETAPAPLTLSEAVTRARRASPRRRAATALVDGAREALRVAGRPPNPILDLRTENWPGSRGPAWPGLDLFAELTQPIELGGRRGIRRALAAAESERANRALGSLERQAALEAAQAYMRALKARVLVDTLAANGEGLSTLVASVGRRVAEGYSPEADLLKLKTEAARIEGDSTRARLEMERSLAVLTVVVGAEAPIQAAQLVEPPPLPPPDLAAGAIADAVARHPDLLAAGAELERARQLAAFERARRLPEPLLTGGYKRSAGLGTMVFGVSVAVPIFDRNEALVAQALGRERAAAAERDVLAYELEREAAALIRAASTMVDQAERAPLELLAPAENVRRAARAAFREGATDVLALVDAERVYRDVLRVALELRLDALLAAIEARFAVGEEALP
ncbi:MAG: TolC family protein [Acidobacteria bacterium]|nr:TolC family protein [Acidobacteriota bacterium]